MSIDLGTLRRSFDEAFAEPVVVRPAATRYLRLGLGDGRAALRLDAVAGVAALPPLARPPRAPAALLGVAILRGESWAVWSLPLLLGPAGADCRWAVLLGGGIAVAAPELLGLAAVDAEIEAPRSPLLQRAIRVGADADAVVDAAALRRSLADRSPDAT